MYPGPRIFGTSVSVVSALLFPLLRRMWNDTYRNTKHPQAYRVTTNDSAAGHHVLNPCFLALVACCIHTKMA